MINTIGLKLTLFAIGFLPLVWLLTLIGNNHNDLLSYSIRASGFMLVYAPLWAIIALVAYVFAPYLFCRHFFVWCDCFL